MSAKFHFTPIRQQDVFSRQGMTTYAVDLDDAFFTLEELELMHYELGRFIEKERGHG